jgi:acetate kinase
MNVLALNCGSSSVKFQLVTVGSGSADASGERCRGRGAIERIGEEPFLTLQLEGHAPYRRGAAVADYAAGVRYAIETIRSEGLVIEAVGHRVVHGGKKFTRPVRIDGGVVSAIEALEELAPLHNGPSLAGIGAAQTVLGPDTPMVAVFDTAFHAGMPDRAAWYAIPHELSVQYDIRRYGFHGISYRWVLSRYCAITGAPADRAAVIAFHLGNGCSAVAIKDGACIDTSMGFTPLEGLVMGTRSGDLDPALIPYLIRRGGLSPAEVDRILNERSGLRGLSGRSRDMRDLLQHAAGDARARLAVEVFCYRARKYLGAYLAALGGAHGLIFTGGIGEHSPEIRAAICAEMEWCGLVLDPSLNDRAVGPEAEIGSPTSRLRVFVIPTDEELLIARDTAACLARATR